MLVTIKVNIYMYSIMSGSYFLSLETHCVGTFAGAGLGAESGVAIKNCPGG